MKRTGEEWGAGGQYQNLMQNKMFCRTLHFNVANQNVLQNFVLRYILILPPCPPFLPGSLHATAPRVLPSASPRYKDAPRPRPRAQGCTHAPMWWAFIQYEWWASIHIREARESATWRQARRPIFNRIIPFVVQLTALKVYL